MKSTQLNCNCSEGWWKAIFTRRFVIWNWFVLWRIFWLIMARRFDMENASLWDHGLHQINSQNMGKDRNLGASENQTIILQKKFVCIFYFLLKTCSFHFYWTNLDPFSSKDITRNWRIRRKHEQVSTKKGTNKHHVGWRNKFSCLPFVYCNHTFDIWNIYQFFASSFVWARAEHL